MKSVVCCPVFSPQIIKCFTDSKGGVRNGKDLHFVLLTEIIENIFILIFLSSLTGKTYRK